MEAMIYDLAMTWRLAQDRLALDGRGVHKYYLLDLVKCHYDDLCQQKHKNDKTLYKVEISDKNIIIVTRYAGKRDLKHDNAMSSLAIDPGFDLLTQKDIADKIEEKFGWRPETTDRGIEVILRKLYDDQLEESAKIFQYYASLRNLLDSAKTFLKKSCKNEVYTHNGHQYMVHAMIDNIEPYFCMLAHSPYELGMLLVSTEWKNMPLNAKQKEFIKTLDEEENDLTVEAAKEWAERSPELFWYVSFVEYRPMFPGTITMDILHKLMEEKTETTDETHEETEEAHEGDTPEQESEDSQGGDNDGSDDEQ